MDLGRSGWILEDSEGFRLIWEDFWRIWLVEAGTCATGFSSQENRRWWTDLQTSSRGGEIPLPTVCQPWVECWPAVLPCARPMWVTQTGFAGTKVHAPVGVWPAAEVGEESTGPGPGVGTRGTSIGASC